MRNFLHIFGVLACATLGWRVLHSAKEHADDGSIGNALAGWVIGCAVLALAVWGAL